MTVMRRGGLAALLGLLAAAVAPGTAGAVVAGAARPDMAPDPILPVNRAVNRMARRTTRHAVRQATRPARRPYPAP